MADKLIKIDKNGTKYYADYACRRCGGQGGLDQWAYTGFTCFECGGSGIAHKPYIYKVYTPEYEAKLTERREARKKREEQKRREQSAELNAEWLKENAFSADGKVYIVLGNTYPIREQLRELGCRFSYTIGWHSSKQLSEYQTLELTADEICMKDDTGVYVGFNTEEVQNRVKEANNAREITEEKESRHYGKIGDRVELDLTVKASYSYETHFTYSGETSYIHTLIDDDGNVFVWKTSRGLYTEEETERETRFNIKEKGDKLTIKGTVKAHDEYKGVKQTVLTRCKIVK